MQLKPITNKTVFINFKIIVMKWIKANKSMPPMFKDVEWRNANGGNIPLGKMSAIEIYKKAGANINSFEWFGESPALAEDGWTTEKPDTMRHDDIRKQYTRHGGAWNNENHLFAVGEQMQYEWERDFIAMKWALERIDDFLRVAEKHKYFTGTLHIAKDELLKRISKYSCPANLKDEYKTKERCPLGDGCKCLANVEINNVQPPNDMQCGVGKNNI